MADAANRAGDESGLQARITSLEAELAAARRAQAFLETIFQHVPDFVIHASIDGRILLTNRVRPGMTLEQVVGSSIFDYVDPASAERMRHAIDRVLATQEAEAYEAQGSGAHGHDARYFSRVVPIFEGDRVTSVLIIATEVTRLKAAEASARESEARLRLALDASAMGIWTWDVATNVGTMDANAARIFAAPEAGTRTMEAALGVIPPDDRRRVVAALEAAVTSGRYGPLEHRIVWPDGSVRWVEGAGAVQPGPEGPRFVGTVVDITTRKQLEARLVEAEKMESIGRLAGGIAHDFNNMLTVIVSNIDLALSQLPRDIPGSDDLREAREAARRSSALTSQLLAFARRQVVAPQPLDLNQLVLKVERLLGRVLGEDVLLETRLSASRAVCVDPHHFERVLLNLAANARDAMKGRASARLLLATRDVDVGEVPPGWAMSAPRGPYVELAVADTGVGISPADLPRVFEPFFTTKAPGQGTGLGLASAYGIVRQSGGHIGVESELGRGATFRILLPAVAETPNALGEPVEGDTEARPSVETILVVEDEPMVRSITVRALVARGYRVLEAVDGLDALRVSDAEPGPIDLVVSDLVMPRMSGRELADALRVRRPETPVLFVSGYSERRLDEAELIPGVELLQKPFMLAQLAERVRQLLARRRAHRTWTSERTTKKP